MTSCDRCRSELLHRPAHTFHELNHLDGCATCRALAESIAAQEARMYSQLTAWIQAPLPARARARPRRWPVVALAAAAVGALWLALSGGPGPGRLEPGAARPQPGSPPAELGALPVRPAPAPVNTLELEGGAAILLSLPRRATSVALDPSGFADATLVDAEHQKLMLVGRTAGDAVLRIALDGSPKPLLYAVAVGPPRTEIASDEAGVQVRVGHAVPVALRAEPAGIHTTDPAVATAVRVGGRLELSVTGEAPGIVDLVVLYAEGPPDVWGVLVEAEAAP